MSNLGLYEALRTTRAVRRLRPDPIPSAVLERILAAASYAPSGGNRQPWRVLVVRDAGLKTELQALYAPLWQAYAAAGRALGASLPEAARDKRERNLAAGDYLAAHLGEVPAILVVCFDPKGLMITDASLGRPSVVGGASIYPAVQNLLLACRAEGVGCVLTTLLCQAEERVRALLEVPDGWGTAAFVPIGYPVGRGHGPVERREVQELAYADKWGVSFVPGG